MIRKITISTVLLLFSSANSAHSAENCASDRQAVLIATEEPLHWNGIVVSIANWSPSRSNDSAPMGLGVFHEDVKRIVNGRIVLHSNVPGFAGNFRIRYGGLHVSDTAFCNKHTTSLVCAPILYGLFEQRLELNCVLGVFDSALANSDSSFALP